MCVRGLKEYASNVGLYKQFTIPNKLGECVSMDLIVGFPKNKIYVDRICVVFDRFRKISHFIPCKVTHDASHINHLFFNKVTRIHDFPISIVSNRDSMFMGHFWLEFNALRSQKLQMPHIRGLSAQSFTT